MELDSLISQVKDLLPDLGEGFILACLEEYSYNAEHVINNILEDKLVPYLDKLDRTMQRCGTSGAALMPLGFLYVGCHLTSLLLKVRHLLSSKKLHVCFLGVNSCSESFSLPSAASFLPSLCPYRGLECSLLSISVEQMLGCVL